MSAASGPTPPPSRRFAVLWSYGVSKWEGRGTDCWVNSLRGEEGEEVWDEFDVTRGEYPPNFGRGYCGCIITGSPSGVYEEHTWIKDLLQWIKGCVELVDGPKIVGGCFGAQALCVALGGDVKATGKFVIRAEDIKGVALDSTPPELSALAKVLGSGIRLLEAHGDACVSLPPKSILLASSASCSHEIFACRNSFGQLRVLALQPHPEFDLLLDIQTRVWPAVQGRLTEEETRDARASYELPRNEKEVCLAVKHFLVV